VVVTLKRGKYVRWRIVRYEVLMGWFSFNLGLSRHEQIGVSLSQVRDEERWNNNKNNNNNNNKLENV